MCQMQNDLMITPGHPVKIVDNWVFPKDMAVIQNVEINAYYNLIVNQVHIALVNDCQVICLGHGLQDDIIRHEYLGTNRVIDDLSTMPGYQEGMVILNERVTPGVKVIGGKAIMTSSISPWHDLPYKPEGADKDVFQGFIEISRGTTAKMEVLTTQKYNAVVQDLNKNTSKRHYGIKTEFNYGIIP